MYLVSSSHHVNLIFIPFLFFVFFSLFISQQKPHSSGIVVKTCTYLTYFIIIISKYRLSSSFSSPFSRQLTFHFCTQYFSWCGVLSHHTGMRDKRARKSVFRLRAYLKLCKLLAFVLYFILKTSRFSCQHFYNHLHNIKY